MATCAACEREVVAVSWVSLEPDSEKNEGIERLEVHEVVDEVGF